MVYLIKNPQWGKINLLNYITYIRVILDSARDSLYFVLPSSKISKLYTVESEISNILSILGIQNGVCANPFDDTHYTFCINRSGTSFDYRCFSEEKNFDDSLVDYWWDNCGILGYQVSKGGVQNLLIFGKNNSKVLSKMSFSSHFVYLFLLILSYVVTFFKSLACFALQTGTIVKKITQPRLPKTKNELTKICNELGKSDKILLSKTIFYFKSIWICPMIFH